MKHGDSAVSGRETVKRGAASHAAAPSSDVVTRPVRARASIDAAERVRLVAEDAYYRAEARGFASGHELDDWLQAEAEIERRLVDQ